MCRKCLWKTDGDDGVDFAVVHVGTRMKSGGKRFVTPNLNRIRFGDSLDTMPGWKQRPYREEPIEFEVDKTDYSGRELEQLADQLLRAAARVCNVVTGKERGIGGQDPILFAEHIYQRQKREILNENGVPEPGLVSGMYYRSHPEGRKVNSDEQRRRNGASYYR